MYSRGKKPGTLKLNTSHFVIEQTRPGQLQNPVCGVSITNQGEKKGIWSDQKLRAFAVGVQRTLNLGTYIILSKIQIGHRTMRKLGPWLTQAQVNIIGLDIFIYFYFA